MLAVDERLALRTAHRLHRGGDGFEVFLAADAERHLNMIIPGLADEAHRVRSRLDHGLEARIVRGRAPGALGHAERGQLRVELRRRLEEGGIDRVRAGIARLDVIDAQRIQTLRDDALVLHRKVYAQRLRPVAQRGVKKIKPFFHDLNSGRGTYPLPLRERVAAKRPGEG